MSFTLDRAIAQASCWTVREQYTRKFLITVRLGLTKIIKTAVLSMFGVSLCGQTPFTNEGYGGPSVLSRGGNQPGYRGSSPVAFRWWAGVGGTYETGLLPVNTQPTGGLFDNGIAGGTAEFGLYGARAWKRSVLGVDYRGDVRKYGRSSYDASDHVLSLGYTMQPNRRWNFGFFETAGTSTRAFGGFTAPTFYNPNLIGVPTSDLFDNRVYYIQTSGQVHYQKSLRTIFGASADGFAVHRQSRSLVGLTGYRVTGRVERALSQRTQIGAIYQFMHFEFPRAFGASDIHGVAAQLRRQFTRTFLFTVSAGVHRLETLGARQVTLSPEVAAILGRPTPVAAIYRINYWPQYGVTLEHRRLNHGATLNYQRGVSPGNGAYLTSGQETINAGYSYTGVRKWAFGLNAGTSRFNSLYQTAGRFSQYQGGGGASYNLRTNLSVSMQADARKFSTDALAGRSGLSVRITLAYSPGDLPLSLW
jgi:hypothetical protein